MNEDGESQSEKGASEENPQTAVGDGEDKYLEMSESDGEYFNDGE